MEKRRRLIIPPRVDRDLVDIWQFGAERWSSETADKHLDRIKEAAEWLCEWPFFGHAQKSNSPGPPFGSGQSTHYFLSYRLSRYRAGEGITS